MKLYRVKYDDPVTNETVVEWFGTEREMIFRRTALKKQYRDAIKSGRVEVDGIPYEVPTAKGPLLEWLNLNANRDG